MNANKTKNNSHVLTILLIISALLLIALILYGNEFHKKNQPDAQQAISQKTQFSPEKTHKISRMQSPFKDVKHPSKEIISEQHEPKSLLNNQSDFKNTLKRQSQDLRNETSAQSIRPNDKRSLTLSEEEIMELENSGRMIY